MTKADMWMRNQAVPFLEKKVESTYNDVQKGMKDAERAEEEQERAEEKYNKEVAEEELTDGMATQKILKDGYVDINTMNKIQTVAHAEVEKEFREHPWAFKSQDNQGAPPWVVCTVFAVFYYFRVVVYS